MRGTVTDYSVAIVEIELRGRYGSRRTVPAIVDTGFSEALTLPLTLLLDLGLYKSGEDRLRLATGQMQLIDVYRGALAVIDGNEVPVEVHRSAIVLLGMKLMQGRCLTIDITPGGEVTLLQSPAQPSSPSPATA